MQRLERVSQRAQINASAGSVVSFRIFVSTSIVFFLFQVDGFPLIDSNLIIIEEISTPNN